VIAKYDQYATEIAEKIQVSQGNQEKLEAQRKEIETRLDVFMTKNWERMQEDFQAAGTLV